LRVVVHRKECLRNNQKCLCGHIGWVFLEEVRTFDNKPDKSGINSANQSKTFWNSRGYYC
jgi:hypothetical protein